MKNSLILALLLISSLSFGQMAFETYDYDIYAYNPETHHFDFCCNVGEKVNVSMHFYKNNVRAAMLFNGIAYSFDHVFNDLNKKKDSIYASCYNPEDEVCFILDTKKRILTYMFLDNKAYKIKLTRLQVAKFLELSKKHELC